MASPTLTDKQLEKKFGRRREGVSVFLPQEYGYRCPRGHMGDYITWSEFNDHIWCYECKVDYPSESCPIQKPCWMADKDFQEFIDRLPFKPQIVEGIQHFPDCEILHKEKEDAR